MSESRRKFFLFIFMGLTGVALFFLFDRMILGRDKFLNARYTDQQFVKLMDGLIEEGVFKIEEGRIILDEEALGSRNLGRRKEARVKECLPFLYIEDRKIVFDKMAVSITNNTPAREDKVLRGKFVDRNGVVLAKSMVSTSGKMLDQKREYSYGPEFYPIIGHWSFIYGKRNLEKEMDAYLIGKKHSPVYTKLSEAAGSVEVGDDIVLTLGSSVQRYAYNLMKGKKGAVVVLEVKTGAILAAVSTPSFDPNIKDWNRWRESFRDNLERPYENRAFSTLYPPGSTFKTVVASAWIEENDGDQREKDYQVDCNGRKNQYRISDIHPHGKVDFNKAFRESCNLFFSEIGVVLGGKLLDYANRFGFNRDLDLIPGMKDYHYKSEKSLAFSWFDNKNGKSEIQAYNAIDFKRNPKIVAQGCIGQNLITATPLQMALIASTIANKGALLNPFIVKEIKTGDGKKTLFSSRPVEIGRAVREATAEKLKRLMIEVMEKGTGKGVKKIYFEDGKYITTPKNKGVNSIPFAGKTGTAEVGDKNGDGIIDSNEKPHSWFIGFGPADNPKVAIAVVVENQGFGSLTAAPIAAEVLSEALNR